MPPRAAFDSASGRPGCGCPGTLACREGEKGATLPWLSWKLVLVHLPQGLVLRPAAVVCQPRLIRWRGILGYSFMLSSSLCSAELFGAGAGPVSMSPSRGFLPLSLDLRVVECLGGPGCPASRAYDPSCSVPALPRARSLRAETPRGIYLWPRKL